MREEITEQTTKQDPHLVENMIAHFPMGCACYEAIFDQARETIQNFIVIATNGRFEDVTGIERETAIGKTASDVFHPLGKKTAEQLIRFGNKVFASDEKVGEAHLSIFHRAYKTTFFFISDTLLLAIYEDVHAQLLRQYFYRTIPHDVIQKSISGQKNAENNGLMSEKTKKTVGPLQKAIFSSNDLDQMTVIPEISVNGAEDVVFLDSLTGLYDRFFAMEALKMYVERGIMPKAGAEGNRSGDFD